MLRSIISFSINNKLVIGVFTIGLIIFGIIETYKLPIDAVPDITNNQVQVITVAPSFGATDIERLVTFPIEQATASLPGLHESRSFSRFGLSLVTLVFDDDVDIYLARQQVSERLQTVKSQLPAEFGNPELGPISTGLGEIYQYVIRPKPGYEQKYDLAALRSIQDWIVKRQLLGVKGVAEVSSFGGKLKQYAVEIDPNKLQSYNITINDVFVALENNNQNTGGAYIEKHGTVQFIRTEGLLQSADEIGNIAIRNLGDGTPLFVRQVANVTTGHATRYGAVCYNDEGEVAGAIVMMLKGANSNIVIMDVKERIRKIEKTLPEGVMIEAFLDRTKMVNNAIKTVEINLLEGALIVLFILVIFLGNLRAGFIVASVIPLSMLFAVIMMNMFGVSGNLMSLGALDFGLIVDGAVIIVEAVMHKLNRSHIAPVAGKLLQQDVDEAVKTSAGKMMNSAVFGQLIILIVYLPILTLEGIEGKMFKPMAQTVAFALMGAFILSLTYVPMMTALCISKKIKPHLNYADRMIAFIEKYYQGFLAIILNYRKSMVAATVIVFLISLVLLTKLGGEFIPTLEEGDFAVDTRVLTGSSLTTTIENTQKAAHILKTRFPEVEKVVTKIGSGEVPTDPMPMEASDMMVILKDKKEWKSAKTFDELADKMNKAVSEVPGITTGFQYPVQMRFNELMTGARQDVVCKLFGEDLDTLSHYAGKLGQIVNTVKGTQDLYVEPIMGMPQIIINYNRNNIAQYGLSVREVNKVVNAAFAGQVAGQVFEGERRFDLVVKLSTELKQDLTDVQQLLIPTPAGLQVPLYLLADVSIKSGPNQVQREEAKRRILVGFNVRGRDVETIVKELEVKTEQQLKLPAGYHIRYGGSFENLNAAKERLMIAVPLSLLLILLLLYFAFSSFRQALLVFSAIPLSAIGGVISLYARDMPFSISAGVGFIALFGVAVLNGIVLIAEFNEQKKTGVKDLRRVVLMGTKVRLRPVLMTALVASLGFLPMALSNGSGAEVQRPLATVVIGGLLTATLLTLFMLPILFTMFDTSPRAHIKRSRKAVVAAALLLLISTTAVAQKPITLEQAIDTALANNLHLQQKKLQSEYWQVMKKSALDIPATNLSAEVGQMNSAYVDNKLSLTQSMSFPTVYRRQRVVMDKRLHYENLNLQAEKLQLRREITRLFYHTIILQEKQILLSQADSIYSTFYKGASLRLSKGKTDTLEKTAVELQVRQVRWQLSMINTDIETTLLQLNTLLNLKETYRPTASNAIMAAPELLDSFIAEQSVAAKVAKAAAEISRDEVLLEKAKLLPDLMLGYNNLSIKGTGADDKTYSGSQRFHSVMFGLGIPILNSAQKARIAAARLNERIAAIAVNETVITSNNEFKKLLLQQKQKQDLLRYYETEALASAELLFTVGHKQFIGGSINYLEWMQLVNQGLLIRANYLDAIREYNNIIIEINYYLNK